MTHRLDHEHHSRQQYELDQDQTLADLDQSISDRDQALADREQAHLNQLRAAGALGRSDDVVAETRRRHQQIELEQARLRHESRQTTIDVGQAATDRHQTLLDEQQLELEGAGFNDGAEYARLEAARARAEAAKARARAAALRAQALGTTDRRLEEPRDADREPADAVDGRDGGSESDTDQHAPSNGERPDGGNGGHAAGGHHDGNGRNGTFAAWGPSK
jgi:hypothetical protein